MASCVFKPAARPAATEPAAGAEAAAGSGRSVASALVARGCLRSLGLAALAQRPPALNRPKMSNMRCP